jgi:hypothetical protein
LTFDACVEQRDHLVWCNADLLPAHLWFLSPDPMSEIQQDSHDESGVRAANSNLELAAR